MAIDRVPPGITGKDGQPYYLPAQAVERGIRLCEEAPVRVRCMRCNVAGKPPSNDGAAMLADIAAGLFQELKIIIGRRKPRGTGVTDQDRDWALRRVTIKVTLMP